MDLKQEYNQIVETIIYQQRGTLFDPLVKFPSDMWIPIIQHATTFTAVSYDTAMATLFSCAFVSKRWYEYITEAPILWSNIYLNDADSNGQDTTVLLATFLHFSQACELYITICTPFTSWESVRDRIAMHRSRIKSIYLGYLSNDLQDEILRFLSPLNRLTRLEGFMGDLTWLLEEETPLAYVNSPISLDLMSLPAVRTLREIETYEDIRSAIPFMRNLHLARSIRFVDPFSNNITDIRFIEPKDIEFAKMETLDWVSLVYLQSHLHFPVRLLTKLPNLVHLSVELWSVQLVLFLLTVHSLNSLESLIISIYWGEPHELPPEIIATCPSLRSLWIYEKYGVYGYDMNYLRAIWKSLVEIFSSICFLSVRGHEFGSAYMSIKSSGFQKLEKLDISEYTFPHTYTTPLLTGKAWFPPSLKKLDIKAADLTLSQVYSQTIECLKISISHNDATSLRLSLSGWPKLRKLTIYQWNGLLENTIHQNLREIHLGVTTDLLDDACTHFCRDIALYPSSLPSLQRIALDPPPEWDIFFIMLERKNFCTQPGVARINNVRILDICPERFLKPIKDLLSGMYVERPSNLDLSVVGNADIMFDPSIPRCIGCHRALRACDLEWDTPHRLEELRLSLPIYPRNTQDILLTWNERAAYWREAVKSGIGRKDSCLNFQRLNHKSIASYDESSSSGTYIY